MRIVSSRGLRQGLGRSSPVRGRRSQSGVALVLVLWVLVLMTSIAGALTLTQRTDVALSTALLDRVRAHAVAEAAVHYAVAQLLQQPASSSGLGEEYDDHVWRADGVPRAWELAGMKVEVTMGDESARIDLNAAPSELLEGLMRAAGLPGGEAAALRDAILDWRDPDDAEQLNGAEDRDYYAAGRPVGAKDGIFDDVSELRLVLGMTPELYAVLEPALTVYSRESTVNPLFASPLVLLAVPGMTEDTVADYLQLRDQRQAGAFATLPAGDGASGLFNLKVGPVYRIRAEVLLAPDGARVAEEAVVRIGVGLQGFQLLAWAPASISSIADGVAEDEEGEVVVTEFRGRRK